MTFRLWRCLSLCVTFVNGNAESLNVAVMIGLQWHEEGDEKPRLGRYPMGPTKIKWPLYQRIIANNEVMEQRWE